MYAIFYYTQQSKWLVCGRANGFDKYLTICHCGIHLEQPNQKQKQQQQQQTKPKTKTKEEKTE